VVELTCGERRVGRQRLYRVNVEKLKPIYDWVTPFERLWSQRYERLDKILQEIQEKGNDMSATKNQTTIIAEPGKQELFITREFDAPRRLVYKAHTDPQLYVQWLGPRGYEMVLETFEPYSGGQVPLYPKDHDGNEYGFHGVFHEISEELMIQTFEFEGLPEKGHVVLDTMRLEELPGARRASPFSCLSIRRRWMAMIQSGMERGLTKAERLIICWQRCNGRCRYLGSSSFTGE